jgi:uncharacterized membrane protein
MIIRSKRKLLRFIDREKIREAIRLAELKTSGEIRVSVAHYFWGNIRKVAERAFRRLEMTKTAERNGILFFIVPSRHRFFVLGDEGIHAKVGQKFWDSVAAHMSERFHKGEFTEGLVRAIGEAGERLAAHFPYNAEGDVNELPDEIDFGKK